MVITVTLNPALDKTFTISNFTLGAVNRVSNIRQDIGGKGINVSKVLKNLGIASISTGFLGGMLEEYFEKELKRRNIETKFISIEEDTRTNIKIVDEINKVYTDVNESGPDISTKEIDDFFKAFKELCSKGDIVVLSGGVSPSVPADIYRSLIKIAKEKEAVTILDADGELLRYGVQGHPNIIKPNIDELKKLVDLEDESEASIIKASRKFIESGIDKILVSLGDKGAMYITKDKAYKVPGLKVPVKSTVGAGDSMSLIIVPFIKNAFFIR